MTRTTAMILALAAVTALAAPTSAAAVAPPTPCVVPNLKYSTLAEARRGLVGTACKLGRVTKRYPKRRHSHHRLKRCPRGTKLLVTRQTPRDRAGTVLPIGSKVNITLTCSKVPPELSQSG